MSNDIAQAPVVVGDIGGTNARFALVGENGDLVHSQTIPVEAFPSFDDALASFLLGVGASPREGCFAVAGPVTDGRASFTNSPWTIDSGHLADRFSLSKTKVINDFEAMSRFSLSPAAMSVEAVKPGTPEAGAVVLTLGPGTGLGVGLSMMGADGPVVLPTEGGHAILPAVTDEEWRILSLISKEVGRPASVEDVVSGPGLLRLHNAMAHLSGAAPADDPAQITDAAMNGDAQAVRTIDQFCAFLGSFAGGLALSTGARGGVMLAGGVLPRVLLLLRKGPFAARFLGEGAMVSYLDPIPVSLIVAGDAALVGAAFVLHD